MADPMTPAERLTLVKDHAVDAWYEFAHERAHKARIPSWRQGTAPDGSPRLTCEVVGPDAARVLHLFASVGPLVYWQGGGGDTKPTYDYQAGRTAVVWRRQGVWVELWVPDTPAKPSQPARSPHGPATATTGGKRLVPRPRPSGRLPFGRRPKTPKETTR
ncbi:hypothetical protein ACFW9D_05855 [Streptomyces sp. NPDC059524]|uniref:hypothetical protein n=1 Tax=Streptomyces sp. NPDC059524 TaxID=3346856 RepID=UPI0036CBD07B